LLQSFLTASGDPDREICGLMAEGVPLGVDCSLPRCPEIFDEKIRWKNSPPGEDEVPRWMENYASAE
jgi:hypothetical protein